MKNKTEKLEQAIAKALEAHKVRVEAKISTELLLAHLVFQIECLLDCEVSEGRKE